jgi:phage/plasmid-associated DNA primase
VRKFPRPLRPAAEAAARDWGDRAAGGVLGEAELAEAEHGLSTLTLHDAEARHIHALLDLLTPDYAEERAKWRDVVYALAGTSENYRPLAVWFSQRCPAKWAEGGAGALDALWAEALARRGAPGGGRPLSVRSIAHWARACDPARYAEAMERSYFTMLTEFVYAHGGRLGHYMVAKVLHVMLAAKFVVDLDAGPRGPLSYCWFEFVLPGQAMRPGEVWKWRREAEPDDVHIYMSEKLTRVLDQIGEHLEERRAAAAEEEQAKYYKRLGAAFALSKGALFNDTFKNGVIRQANYLFRRRGFVEGLDADPRLLGVGNGVLDLGGAFAGGRAALLDHYHEHAVSRFTPVHFKRFDPADPWTRLALDAMADIVPEPDARDWILFHAAQGLSGEPKEGLFLLWEGGGQNGKTSFLRWVAKALGPYADKFNIQLMSCEREDADRPNSAMMRFKHLRFAYSEEANKAQVLNVARMKEMVNPGEVSGRELNSRQETFTMRANFVAASQYSFIVNTTDHGTWRRLRHYTSKTKFRARPEPGNPFEKPEDQRFVREFPDNPHFQASVLSILVHYFERLQREFRGELKAVPCPTIEAETEAFRVGQDSLHRWISECVVLTPAGGPVAEVPLGVAAGLYCEWFVASVDRRRPTITDVVKEIESSALGAFVRPGLNGARFLVGCRLLALGEPLALAPGEAFAAAPRLPPADLDPAGPPGRDEAAAAGGRPPAEWWLPRAAAAPGPPPGRPAPPGAWALPPGGGGGGAGAPARGGAALEEGWLFDAAADDATMLAAAHRARGPAAPEAGAGAALEALLEEDPGPDEPPAAPAPSLRSAPPPPAGLVPDPPARRKPKAKEWGRPAGAAGGGGAPFVPAAPPSADDAFAPGVAEALVGDALRHPAPAPEPAPAPAPGPAPPRGAPPAASADDAFAPGVAEALFGAALRRPAPAPAPAPAAPRRAPAPPAAPPRGAPALPRAAPPAPAPRRAPPRQAPAA